MPWSSRVAFSTSMNSYRALTDTPGRRRPQLFPESHSSAATHEPPPPVRAASPAPTTSTAAPPRHEHADTHSPNSATSAHSPRSHVRPSPPASTAGPPSLPPRPYTQAKTTYASVSQLLPSLRSTTVVGCLSGKCEALHLFGQGAGVGQLGLCRLPGVLGL